MFSSPNTDELQFNGEEIPDTYHRENQDSIRSEMEAIARQRVAIVIGHENLSKATLTFSEADLKNLKMQLEGPNDLKAKIEEALRTGKL
jgi:hypothetical protein